MTDLARDLRHERKACNPLALCIELGLADGHGTFKRQAGGVIVRCPAHEEKNPSCSIRVAEDGTIAVRCHACGWSGDAITLIRQVRGLGFREALAELARIASRFDVAYALARRRTQSLSPAPVRPKPALTRAPTASSVDPELCDRVLGALLNACPLREQADVAAYVHSRAIYADAEAIGCGALPAPAMQASLVDGLVRTFGLEALAAVGLVDEGGALRAPSHRLVIPWRTRAGKLASLQRRVIRGHGRKYEWPHHVPTPRDLFGEDLVDEARAYFGNDPPIVVTEGALDCLARRKIARLSDEQVLVVAVPSASTVRPEWAPVFNDRTVLIATDPDDAGDRCARALVNRCLRGARKVERERCKFGDWNEALVRVLAGEVDA